MDDRARWATNHGRPCQIERRCELAAGHVGDCWPERGQDVPTDARMLGGRAGRRSRKEVTNDKGGAPGRD